MLQYIARVACVVLSAYFNFYNTKINLDYFFFKVQFVASINLLKSTGYVMH